MKKNILLAAAAISLIACNSEDNYIDDPVAAHISASIGESAPSRVRDVEWDKNDCIGISMSGRYLNMKYETKTGDGIFSGTTLYFKNKQEPVTITAYYPYAGSENQTPAVVEANTEAPYQTSDEQSKYDFLYAAMEGVTGAQPNVNLQFSHQMSKLTLVFKNGNDGTNVGLITSYTIEGLVHEGTFNPVSGVCVAKSGVDAKPITMTPASVEHDKALPSLLIFPQEVTAVTLKIKDSQDQDYICNLRFADNRLESGNNYLYTITVKKTGLSVNPSINDWTVVDHIGDDPLGGDAISDDSDDNDDTDDTDDTDDNGEESQS